MSMSSNNPNNITTGNAGNLSDEISYPKIESTDQKKSPPPANDTNLNQMSNISAAITAASNQALNPTKKPLDPPIKPKKYTHDQLIREFENLKKEIMRLNKIMHEARLFDQYQKLMNGILYFKENPPANATGMSLATDEFAALIEEYQKVFTAYTELKQSIYPDILPKTEVDNIENSVSSQHANRASLKFYPDEQKRFNAATQTDASKTSREGKQQIYDYVKRQYEDRATDYVAWHKVTGVCSIFIIGLPFLVGGLVVHAIDKLITSIRLKASNPASVNKEIEDNIKKDINRAPDTRLRQSIFATAQTYHTNNLDETKEKIENAFKRPGAGK